MLEDEQKFKLGGCRRPLFHVLTVNFSEINRVFAPCSMHTLFNPNKFHKFWMSCACKRSHPKNGRKWRKSRPSGLVLADRPDTSTYMGASLLQEQRDMLTMPLNQGLSHDSVGGPERHGHQPNGPTSRCPDDQTSVIPNLGAISGLDLQRR